MHTVVLCGEDAGHEMEHALFDVLCAAGLCMLYVTDRAVSFIPRDPRSACADFLVLDNPSLRDVDAPEGIAVFRRHAPEKRPRLPAAFFAVVDSDNRDTAGVLRGAGIDTVICGLSQKDTVTFSSIGSDRAVVSLQRGLKTLTGGAAGPVEVPVAFSQPRGEYSLLASVAVLLLAGTRLPEGGLVLPRQPAQHLQKAGG